MCVRVGSVKNMLKAKNKAGKWDKKEHWVWLKFRDTRKGFAKEMTRVRTSESEGASCLSGGGDFLTQSIAITKSLKWECAC